MLPSLAAPFQLRLSDTESAVGLPSCSIWNALTALITWQELFRLCNDFWGGKSTQYEWEGWRAGRGGPPWWGFPGVCHHNCHCEGVMTGHQAGIKVMGGEMTIPAFPVTCTCSWLSQKMPYLSKDKPQSLAAGPSHGHWWWFTCWAPLAHHTCESWSDVYYPK